MNEFTTPNFSSNFPGIWAPSKSNISGKLSCTWLGHVRNFFFGNSNLLLWLKGMNFVPLYMLHVWTYHYFAELANQSRLEYNSLIAINHPTINQITVKTSWYSVRWHFILNIGSHNGSCAWMASSSFWVELHMFNLGLIGNSTLISACIHATLGKRSSNHINVMLVRGATCLVGSELTSLLL